MILSNNTLALDEAIPDRLIYRVVLISDGTVHIVNRKCEAASCSVKALRLLLSNPLNFDSFMASTQVVHTTKRFEMYSDNINTFPGITLINIYHNKNIENIFPEILDLLSTYKKDDAELNFSKYLKNTEIEDEKTFLLKFFVSTVAQITPINVSTKTLFKCSIPEQKAIIQEIINTAYLYAYPPGLRKKSQEKKRKEIQKLVAQKQVKKVNEEFQAKKETAEAKNKLVTIQQYAEIHSIPINTVSSWVQKGKLKTAQKINNRWYVDIDDIAEDHRKNRIAPGGKHSSKKRVTLKGDSFEDIQEYIKERKLVTDDVRPFIRTKEEIKYYEIHNYHEVKWDGHSYMIIDVNLDYIRKSDGKSNREIILSGGAPVVPNDDDNHFHLHHIGQKKNSPLAIIPASDHNSEALYSKFHQGNPDSDLHGEEFTAQKELFWKTYIEAFDIYKNFQKIPCLNLKHKKNQR